VEGRRMMDIGKRIQDIGFRGKGSETEGMKS
jgi:hypothetical protein